MGTDNIPARSGGQTITAQFFNLLRSVLGVDIVPRNSSGVTTDLAGSVGTSTYRFLSAFAQKYNVGASASGLSIEEVSGSIIVKVNSTEVFRLSTTELLTTGIDFADNIITRDALKDDVVKGVSSQIITNSTSTSLVDITNATTTFTRTGKPVDIFLQPSSTTNSAQLGVENSSGGRCAMYIALLRGGSVVARWNMDFQRSGTGQTYSFNSWPAGGIRWTDFTTSTGSTTYKLQWQKIGGTTMYCNYLELVAAER
jgi:hypothetical protein